MKIFFTKVLFIILHILVSIINILLLPFNLIFSIYRYFFPPPKRKKIKDRIEEMTQDGAVVSMNYDDLDEEERINFRGSVSKYMDFPEYNGTVKHAYDIDFVKDTDLCPRCRENTRQCYANFIYYAQKDSSKKGMLRAIFLPGGYFCAKCPTVIVDQEMISEGVTKGYTFDHAIGITYDDPDKGDDYFKTWNGDRQVVVADSEDESLDIIAAPPELKSRVNARKKKRKRKKQAKKSKRKNRKK